MKFYKLIIIFTLIKSTSVIVSNSQVLTDNPPSNNQASQNNSTTVINQEPKRSDKPFLGTDIPIFNPGTEVFSWDGQNWNINNNRLMRARFEKYLNTPADNSAVSYTHLTLPTNREV